MKYAFIDYENLNSLDGLELQQYAHIFLFIGAAENQTTLRLTEQFNDEVNLTLITVKHIAKNNVDFHIAYYLGKLDNILDKNIEFHILSKDKGYEGLCYFIQHQKNHRVCFCKTVGNPQVITQNVLVLPSPPDEQTKKEKIYKAFEQYRTFIFKVGKRSLPVKLTKLRNDICNRTLFKDLDKQKELENINKVINKLQHEKLIKVVNNKVSYP